MKLRVFGWAMLFVLVLGLIAAPALAHEGREVGEYSIVFGWRVEPAYTGQVNGPEIFVSRHSHEAAEEHSEEAEATPEMDSEHTNEEAHEEAGEMITGLEDTLQIEVSFGPATRVLNLRAVWNDPGHYTADLMPMMPGDYTFRVFGTIEGVEVDETFTSADGEFSPVEPIEDIQFP